MRERRHEEMDAALRAGDLGSGKIVFDLVFFPTLRTTKEQHFRHPFFPFVCPKSGMIHRVLTRLLPGGGGILTAGTKNFAKKCKKKARSPVSAATKRHLQARHPQTKYRERATSMRLVCEDTLRHAPARQFLRATQSKLQVFFCVAIPTGPAVKPGSFPFLRKWPGR